MKKLIIFICFLICFLIKSKAQFYENFGQPSQNYTFPDFDKFVGKWKYVNGLDTLIIDLKKVIDTGGRNISGGSYTYESLIGYQHFVKNDTLYDDSYNLMSARKSKATIRLCTFSQTPYNSNFVKGVVINNTTRRLRYLKLEYLPNGNIKWKTWAYRIPVRFNSPVPSYTNALPDEVELIKQ